MLLKLQKKNPVNKRINKALGIQEIRESWLEDNIANAELTEKRGKSCGFGIEETMSRTENQEGACGLFRIAALEKLRSRFPPSHNTDCAARVM